MTRFPVRTDGRDPLTVWLVLQQLWLCGREVEERRLLLQQERGPATMRAGAAAACECRRRGETREEERARAAGVGGSSSSRRRRRRSLSPPTLERREARVTCALRCSGSSRLACLGYVCVLCQLVSRRREERTPSSLLCPVSPSLRPMLGAAGAVGSGCLSCGRRLAFCVPPLGRRLRSALSCSCD